jgi:hypothetical protein
MTTFADARGELVTALAGIEHGATSDPGRIVPPAFYIAGDGADVTHVVMGKFPSTWRIVLVADGWDSATGASTLDSMKQAALAALRSLTGWQLQPLGRDGVRVFSDKQYLTAELRGVRMIDV